MFDLQCDDGCAAFEAWFRSTSDYDEQREAGLVQCPFCRSTGISKAPMAPRVPPRNGPGVIEKLAAVQAEMLKDSRWVGERFAQTALAMHSGEIEHETVHGSATAAEVKALADEGVPVAALPFPVVPPTQVN